MLFPQVRRGLRRIVRGFNILIVADDGGYYQHYGTCVDEFKKALSQAGYTFDVWVESVDGTIGQDIENVLNDYDLVIWTCGDYSGWVINPREAQALLDYFWQGGNVLIEGKKALFNLVRREETALLKQMLQVNYKEYQVETEGVQPTGAHSITRGLGSSKWVDGWQSIDNRLPDGIKIRTGWPYSDAQSVMKYQNSDYTAVSVCNPVRHVSDSPKGAAGCYTFAMYMLPKSYRNKLVANTVEWFASPLRLLEQYQFSVGFQHVYNYAQRRPEDYQYKTLPDACICTECGYILENPDGHCRYINCPECGSSMWRKRV